jgi:hypothetical protein
MSTELHRAKTTASFKTAFEAFLLHEAIDIKQILLTLIQRVAHAPPSKRGVKPLRGGSAT